MFKTRIQCMKCNRWVGNIGSVSLANLKILCSNCITTKDE